MENNLIVYNIQILFQVLDVFYVWMCVEIEKHFQKRIIINKETIYL